MVVAYEPRSRTAIVTFRARVTVLPGRFSSEPEAIAAGEAFCLDHGWRPACLSPARAPVRSAW